VVDYGGSVMRVRAGRGLRIISVVAVTCGLLCCLSSGATALPVGRLYEMVSPPYTGGYGATAITAVSSDGESVTFTSPGASFGGSPTSTEFNGYLARRNANGWSTVSLQPPTSIAPDDISQGFPTDVSTTLESSLSQTKTGVNAGSSSETGETTEFLLHASNAPETEAGFEVAGIPLSPIEGKPYQEGLFYLGASTDFSHVVFGGHRAEPLLTLAGQATEESLYDLKTGKMASLRLVGVNNDGELIDPYCPVVLGSASGAESQFNAISADGQEIFFTDNANRADTDNAECDATKPTVIDPANPALLYVRVNGEKTLQVSAPVAADCAALARCQSALPARAEFNGADEAGKRVFFTTAQPLVTGDTDDGLDLYMANIGCPGSIEGSCEAAAQQVTSMTQVSHSTLPGEAAKVQGVLRVAPDGSRVYFVALGVLSEGQNAEGAVPVKGADNLYVYDATSGKTSFITDLCSGSGMTGGIAEPHCPGSGSASDTGLWEHSAGQAQTGGADGDYLVFSTYGQLVGGDINATRDVYRYDATTGELNRVSIGEDGYDANGNGGTSDASIHNGEEVAFVTRDHDLKNRAISEDGSRVVFITAEPLSPDAVNGLTDVYEWHQTPGSSKEGVVSLVSPGEAEQPVEPDKVVMDPSGNNIFFITIQGLVPQDTNDTEDVYDARLGGGFPPAPTPQQPCAGDSCQGPLSTPAPLLVPGSAVQAPGEDLAPASKHAVKTNATPKKKKKKPEKRKSKGRVSYRVTKGRKAIGGKR
jgi:hypothetical protein